jgi:hypothetical protein
MFPGIVSAVWALTTFQEQGMLAHHGSMAVLRTDGKVLLSTDQCTRDFINPSITAKIMIVRCMRAIIMG